jgi:hypothetical protein
MQKIKTLLILTFLCLLVTSPKLQAQTEQIDRNEWLKQMNEEELKITAYIDEQMKDTIFNDSLRQVFLSSSKHHEANGGDFLGSEEDLRSYYRKKYLDTHPEVVAIYNPGRVTYSKPGDVKSDGGTKIAAAPQNILCNDGDFEAGASALSSYAGYLTYSYWGVGGLCNFIPFTNVAYTPVPLLPGSMNFDLTNNVPDIHAPIYQTHNSSNHAVRINGWWDCGRFGMNMLQKNFSSPVTGKVKINFSYALVMQGPHTDGAYQNGNSFFVARVLDNNGNEIGTRHCVSAIDPGFANVNTVLCESEHLVPTLYRDWDCDFIEFDAEEQKSYTIEFFVSGCQWKIHYGYAYVDDICAEITCCNDAPTPTGLECRPTDQGSNLSWTPVPGASYYKVFINQDDPECCNRSNNPLPVSYIWNVNAPHVLVPTSTAPCFSWFVVAVMPDSCKSEFSEKLCSCNPKPPSPDSLDCDTLFNGSRLYWNAVPGADHYKIQINQYDPACCERSPIPNPISVIWTSTSTNIAVSSLFADCFSWSVITVMMDGTESDPSQTKCSCTPTTGRPTDLDCDSIFGASRLTWGSVPGAVSYKVTINQYDPLCCGIPPIPNPISAIWTVTATTVDVPHIFATCFSWSVIAVLANGKETERSITMCSCSDTGTVIIDPEPRSLVPGTNRKVISTNLHVSAVPNPASDYVDFIVHNKDNQKEIVAMTLYLYDLNGKEVIKKKINNNRLRIDVQSYTDGMYIYVIRNNKNEVLFKDKVMFKK